MKSHCLFIGLTLIEYLPKLLNICLTVAVSGQYASIITQLCLGYINYENYLCNTV